MSTRLSRILSLLPYFVAVAEELHFARAAKRLGMSQPPLSRRIRILERDLGSELLERNRHSVALTRTGELLLRLARDLIGNAEEAVEEVHRLARSPGQRLRLGFINSTLHSILPPIIATFKERFPDVELMFSEASTETQIAGLQMGHLDVGLLRLAPGEDHGLRTALVWRDPLVAVLPIGHPLAGRRSVHLADLSGERFITYSRQAVPRLRERIVRSCETAGFSPVIVQEARRASTLIALVAAGFGISLVPTTAAETTAGQVRFVPLRGADINVEVSVAMSRVNGSGMAEALFGIARETATLRTAAAAMA